jgi:hypothetical protein
MIEIGIHAEEECIFVAHPEGRHASAKLRALSEHRRAIFGTPPYWETWRRIRVDIANQLAPDRIRFCEF